MTRTVRVRNYSNNRISYAVKPSFRFANDEANGAVSISAPSTVAVGPGARPTRCSTSASPSMGLCCAGTS